MTTVINTPPSSGDNGGSGVIVGVIVLLVVVILLFFFGVPLLRGTKAPAPQAPASGGVQVPSQIDVNINKPAQ